MGKALNDVIAERLRALRQSRKLTIEQLAGRCEGRLTATAIGNFERAETKARPRRNLTVQDLLTLALALHVPPLVLVTPVGAEETFELLPGVDIAPLDAWRWIVGESPLLDADADEAKDYRAAQQPIGLALEHDRWVYMIESELAEQRDDADSDGVDYQEIVPLLMSLESVRRIMEALGMIIPELSDGVTQALEESGEFITYPGYRPSTMRRPPHG